jgi:hypothetical protein
MIDYSEMLLEIAWLLAGILSVSIARLFKK